MRALTRPNPAHSYQSAAEINRLIAYRDAVTADPTDSRNIPQVGQQGQVLIATWNIANLGVHVRRPPDIRIISEVLSWFEIVAIQEIADNLDDFYQVLAELPDYFDFIFSDRAGNDERAAYIFDTRRVSLGPVICEVAIVDSDRKHIKLEGINFDFSGFNRNPYLVSFTIENTDIMIANCHLLYGPSNNAAQRAKSLKRRQLEAYAIARYCDLRRDDQHSWTSNIMAVGDFNLPLAQQGDPIFDALTNRGLRLPPHATRVPTNVSNTADYDQISVTPGLLSRVTDIGVFDFDGVLFPSLYNPPAISYWRTCVKYYISDHRPLWMQFEL